MLGRAYLNMLAIADEIGYKDIPIYNQIEPVEEIKIEDKPEEIAEVDIFGFRIKDQDIRAEFDRRYD